MNQEEKAAWERIRAKGLLRFVLTRGVLGWSITYTVLVTLANYLISRRAPGAGEMLSRSVVALFTGIVVGMAWWVSAERRYHKLD
jgi:hypothetical protein